MEPTFHVNNPSAISSPDVVWLLDYFAAKAMQGYLSSSDEIGAQAVQNPSVLAQWAYDNAQAMLAEREKRLKQP